MIEFASTHPYVALAALWGSILIIGIIISATISEYADHKYGDR